MVRLIIPYIVIGVAIALLYAHAKKEERFPVLLAVGTGWPVFMWALVGSGWNALLNERKPLEPPKKAQKAKLP